MISLTFNLRNPWSNKFKNLWCRAYATPFKNKFVELEFYQNSTLLCFMFGWTVQQDHAGLDIELGLFGYNAHFNFYDNRHWDSKKKAWQTYEENLL
jgi:hypothetical protein